MIPYLREIVAGAVIVIMLALGATALWYRGEAISAAADASRANAALAAAKAANAANLETIRKLNLEIALNDKIVSDLTKQKSRILSALNFSNKALSALKASHEDVRAYLDTPVPDALRRLYDGKAGHGGADPDHPAKRASGTPGARTGAMER